uniref:ShKT domain-containing protein n=1 Tax=Chrysotila carterae TaxID=13221 RepID=A0A7S4EWD7_CHRCT
MIHTVFSAECNPTFDWHSVALFHSHRTSGQPGGITRLLACSPEKLRTYQGLDIGPTFVHRNHRDVGGQNYAAFNKPASVTYWMASGEVPAGVEYVMQLDADMLINRPVDPIKVGAAPGVVVSAPYNYLVGTDSGLADEMGVVNKSLQARCGGMHLFHIDDLRRIAPLWLHFTQKVRSFACQQPQRYYELAAPKEDQNAGSKGVRRQFMWMVEMYGYVFGAAEAGVQRHRVTAEMMGYVGQVELAPGPYILHYGIDWSVPTQSGLTYEFNKLSYVTLDVASCPRWFFPVPPFGVEEAPSYKAKLCIAQMVGFNEALCGYYQRHCKEAPPCPPRDMTKAPDPKTACVDTQQNCLTWSRSGECEVNPGFMHAGCRQSCGACERPGRVMMGSNATCLDLAKDCDARVQAGECDTQRAEMQEICRRSCMICSTDSTSADTPVDKRSFDHTCPDGSDLGGGENSSPSLLQPASSPPSALRVKAASPPPPSRASLSRSPSSVASVSKSTRPPRSSSSSLSSPSSSSSSAAAAAAAASASASSASSPSSASAPAPTRLKHRRRANVVHARPARDEVGTPNRGDEPRESRRHLGSAAARSDDGGSLLPSGLLIWWPSLLVWTLCSCFLGYVLRGTFVRPPTSIRCEFNPQLVCAGGRSARRRSNFACFLTDPPTVSLGLYTCNCCIYRHACN